MAGVEAGVTVQVAVQLLVVPVVRVVAARVILM
jgi:hypothetical protein